MQDYISGIQQVGIGVQDAGSCSKEYARLFGMDTLVFDDVAEARLMTRYTGGQVYRRRAVLALNMQGGGGFEIWQFQNRDPAQPLQNPMYGDVGIYAAKIKCPDIVVAFSAFSKSDEVKTASLQTNPRGEPYFLVEDRHGNVFEIVSGNHWFQKKGHCTGGVTGAVIGVTDIDRSIPFYKMLLGANTIAYDQEVAATDGTDRRYRKVLFQKHPSGKGAFGKLLGSVELELIQCLDRTPQKIYADRFWGDCGFIHLCFDVFDMCGLKRHAEASGYRFTVDSQESFAMEGASGRFCYIEDPDGTLIELVETHRVPVYKKLGIYLNLKKRSLEKPLPDWMIKLLALSKVR